MSYAFTKEQVLKAVANSYGIMSQVARGLGDCSWSTAERYVNKWEETRQAFRDAGEQALDFTEGQMLAAIKNGDGPMIRFHLATKGKRRGYVMRMEETGKDGGPVERVLRLVHDRDSRASGPRAEGDAPEAA